MRYLFLCSKIAKTGKPNISTIEEGNSVVKKQDKVNGILNSASFLLSQFKKYRFKFLFIGFRIKIYLKMLIIYHCNLIFFVYL